ncbi:MAG: hypothetical protein L6R41_001524 [Letrouitia leprolyta]|nr:MAG: hypothetical protein L6R41_001524 [Letrouitia leprolyta]
MPSTDNNRLTASDMGPIEDSGTFEVGLRDDAHNVLPSIVNGSNSYWQPANQQNNSRVPFDPTKIQQRVQCEDGTSAQPLIEVTVEKGFFKADGDWTCYRRNYFSIDCSFRFEEDFLFPPYYIKRQDGSQSGLITLFHLAVTAISDSGRQIKLASHANTKRGSGPAPVTEGPLTFSKAIDPRSLFAEWTVSFQRMQFTLATANNGRRRASQQYFHLLVELFCETSGKHKPLILLALRKSAPIVVRGRSPGHYSEDISSMPIGASFPPSIPEIHSSSNLHMLSRPEITGMELVEEGYEPVTVATDTSDASSISSMQSSRSALSSKSSISSQEQNPQKFVDILLLDSGFKSLCIDGFRCIDADRFERNLRRLLRIFIKTLRAQLPSRLRSILRYYKFERAVNLARALRTLFANNDAEKRSMLQLKNAKVDKEKLFDQYLDDNIADYTEFDHLDTVEPSEQANGADSDVELFNTHFAGFPREAPNQSSRDYTKPGPLHALQQDVDSTSSDSDQSLAEDSYEALAPSLIPKLIFESDAWEELREGLMGLLVPILMSMYHEEHDRKRSECTLVHRTAYQDALPVTRSLIVDCKGACQILLEERRLHVKHDKIRD